MKRNVNGSRIVRFLNEAFMVNIGQYPSPATFIIANVNEHSVSILFNMNIISFHVLDIMELLLKCKDFSVSYINFSTVKTMLFITTKLFILIDFTEEFFLAAIIFPLFVVNIGVECRNTLRFKAVDEV